jgi:hypothetical protein
MKLENANGTKPLYRSREREAKNCAEAQKNKTKDKVIRKRRKK